MAKTTISSSGKRPAPRARTPARKKDSTLELGFDKHQSEAATSTAVAVQDREFIAGASRPAGVARNAVFYIPVAPLRAQVYLAHGLIYPAAYDNVQSSSGMKDIQADAPNSLTIYRTAPPLKQSSNEILLGVVLTNEEIGDMEQNGDVAYLSAPIPISRLVGIGVPVASAALPAYIDGWIEPDVPVPDHLFYALNLTDTPASKTPDTPRHLPPAKFSNDLKEAVQRFDRLMGLFAYHRNAARYLSSRLGTYSDYPGEFFSAANTLFKSPLATREPKVELSPIVCALIDNTVTLTQAQRAIVELVLSTDTFIEKPRVHKLAIDLYDASSKDVSLKQAFKSLFDGDYKSSVQLLQQNNLSMDAAVLAALYKFSDRQTNDHRNVKQTLHADWANVSVVATILAVLGAYYGYTALDAVESRLYAVDKRLADCVEKRPFIKFRLDTRFERDLIEAIYQWVFLSKQLDSQTSALYDALEPKSAAKPVRPPVALYRDTSYSIADLLIRRYEVTSLGRLLQRLEQLPAPYVDETSEVGRCLMHPCFFYADEFEFSRKQGKHVMRYRISKPRLLELITDGSIRVNERLLLVAMEEDSSSAT